METKVLKGTTTVGLTFADGVILAADKRAVMGSLIAAKEVDKIFLISDKIGLTMAGAAGDGQTLAKLMRAELELYKYSKGREASASAASNLLANILQSNKYFPYFVQILIGGISDKTPEMYNIDAFGGVTKEKYTSTGSGSIVAFGILDEFYKKDMNKKDAISLAVKAVSTAMKRDVYTGEGIDVVCITPTESKRYTPEEVKNFL